MKHFIVLSALLLLPISSWASSNNLSNSAQVVSACSIRKTQDLNFGVFNPLDQSKITGNGQLELNCTKGTYRVSLGAGTGGGWFTNTRLCFYQMKNQNGKTAIYYPSASYSESTSSGINPSANSAADCASATVFLQSYTFTETVRSQTVNVYAMTEKSQFFGSPQVGTYTDTLTVSVQF